MSPKSSASPPPLSLPFFRWYNGGSDQRFPPRLSLPTFDTLAVYTRAYFGNTWQLFTTSRISYEFPTRATYHGRTWRTCVRLYYAHTGASRRKVSIGVFLNVGIDGYVNWKVYRDRDDRMSRWRIIESSGSLPAIRLAFSCEEERCKYLLDDARYLDNRGQFAGQCDELFLKIFSPRDWSN